jgi:PIN domain nuclease of toxin-antitoxin system
MRVLLDTQVVVEAYIAGAEKLSPRVVSILENPESVKLISVVSITEIALKQSIGKSSMNETDIREAIRDLNLIVIPFEEEHAFELCHLPLHHRDPFDRMIIATALAENVPLIGADRMFKAYKGLKVIR